MTLPMPIRAITFDFWRTLFRDNDASKRQEVRVAALIEVTGRSRKKVESAFDVTWKEFSRFHIEEQRTLRPEDAVRLTLDALGESVTTDVFQQLTDVFATAILEYPPVPIDGALEAVSTAAQLVPVGIVSDSGVSPGSALRQLLARNGFEDHFAAMAFSDEVTVSKPQALMFETAARGLGVQPQELLHIGDLEPTDIVGAKQINARAALFAGDNDRFLGNTTADYTFTSWHDFVAMLPDFL